MEIVRHIAVVYESQVREIFSFSFLKDPLKPNHIVCSPELYQSLFGETPYERLTPKEFLNLMVEFYGESEETYKNIERYVLLTYPKDFVNPSNPN